MPEPLHVLIVEDDPLDAELVLGELRNAGFDPVWQRVDNEAAFRAHLSLGLEIILSDYSMPQFDGFRALRLLKESRLEIPFILISATIGEETAVEAMKLGAADYLLKDRLARLGPAIRHALEQNCLRKERELVSDTLRLRERALAQVSQGVLICNEDRLIIYANTSFTTITGYSQAEVVGRSCAILQGPESDPQTILKIRAALNAEEPFEGEILNYRRDGTPFWNELSLAPIRNAGGGPTRFIGIQRDVTEGKLAREALEKSEEHVRHERALLRALIDSIPDLVFLKDKDSVFLGCNKAFEKHFGISEEKLVGRTDYDLVPVDVAETYRSRDHELLVSGKSQRIEEWISSSDGKGAYFETVKTPYYGPDGQTLGLIAVSRDITERKQAGENQRVVSERLKLAAEAGHVGIWEMDAATRKMDWDDQMRILYGLPVVGGEEGIEEIRRAMHPEDVARFTTEFEEALWFENKPLNTEYRIHRIDDGSLRHIRSMATVIRNESGDPQRIVGTNWDITEERMREGKLYEALSREKELARAAEAGNRVKSEFLAVMSHEIRTPMNGILGFSELLAGSSNLPPDCRDCVKTIMTSGEALLRILDDILDYSRLEAGGLKIENSWFSAREILGDIHALLAPHAGDKHLEFRVAWGDDMPDRFLNDAGRLRQILLNLVGNAIKFTAEGSITIGMRLSREILAAGRPGMDFFVRDTGPGIPPESLGHIFEPFSQGDSSISRRYGGTGLGLSISQNLVKLMGGKLSVSSEVGAGSEFYVTLPFSVSDTMVPARIGPGDLILGEAFAADHPLSILLVEDDRVNRKLMVMTLHRLGYQPLIARDGMEAVAVYDREHPDCVLMDLQMPRKDGLQATVEIRKMENAMPGCRRAFITALTANIVAEDRQRCFEAGMDEYMNKPIKHQTLAKALRQASELKNSSLRPAR